ncbi:3-hydroxyacyl-CoA dehydrogenase family protein [Sphingobacterium sp. SYP-B4668]|uniref:3-hydroxyacyl-CoA dehydrogenase family protein n=1 Tax=Sphingobacterium sp. SYP-B4668 TaxID=2996035 RepID=UPI0022DDEA74|nr:3-hydroxyacyl-CoA dehydrogenase family protein [Sphingobacterium sp. SYP-B4668]
MNKNIAINNTVLIVGDTPIAASLFAYLKKNNHTAELLVDLHISPIQLTFDIIIVLLEDDLDKKVKWLEAVTQYSCETTLWTVNIDGINLYELQRHIDLPILGLNFSFPVEASPFMEIVVTEKNPPIAIDTLKKIGMDYWHKDPYVVSNGISARAYMMAAMTREAFFLVDNGYASIESVDRACRNDAGYYLPFTGNFLYMDLMGTMAYALVMKELNPELAVYPELPTWFEELVKEGKGGMQQNEGFYTYSEGDYEKWSTLVQEFTIDIKVLIEKYNQTYEEVGKEQIYR